MTNKNKKIFTFEMNDELQYEFTNIKWAFTSMGIAIAVCLYFLAGAASLNGDKVDCYDRYNNKIIGEKCVVEGGFTDIWGARLAFSMFGLFIIAIFYGVGSAIDGTFGTKND